MLISWILSQSQILFDFFYWFAVNDQPFTTRDKLIPKKLMQNSFSFSMLWECSSIPWTQNVNRTSIRRSENVLDVFWTYYISSIYALCLGCNLDVFITFLATIFSDHKRFLKIYRPLMFFQRSSWKFLKISKIITFIYKSHQIFLSTHILLLENDSIFENTISAYAHWQSKKLILWR